MMTKGVTTAPVTMAPVTMEWLVEDAINPAAGQSLARMSVDIGVASELHHHTHCTETIHVLEGEIEQRIGDEWIKMAAEETCLIPIGAKHQTRNVGKVPAVMMIAYSAGTRVYISDAG